MSTTKNIAKSPKPLGLTKTDKQASSNELIKREDIENSPFEVITTSDGSFGAMGQYRITEVMETKEAVKEDLKEMSWNRVIQVMTIILDINNKNAQ